MSSINLMPQQEICSYCYVERLAMMQRTPYSIYDQRYAADLEYVYGRCGLTGDQAVPPPVDT